MIKFTESEIINFIHYTLELINEKKKVSIDYDLPEGQSFEFSNYMIYQSLKEETFTLFLNRESPGDYWTPPDSEYVEQLESKDLYTILNKVIELDFEERKNWLGESFDQFEQDKFDEQMKLLEPIALELEF